MSLVINTPKGLFCPAGGFYLDSRRAVDHAVVSHAHADHAAPGNRNVYCTPPTRALIQHRYGKRTSSLFHEYNFGDSFEIGKVKITLYPAGHMLGSAQILLEHQGVRVLYTGDFKLHGDHTCEAFEFVKADALITEATYARQDVSHPDPVSEIRRINTLQGKNMIIGAYVMGKAQRIAGLLAKYCPDRYVLIHPDIIGYQVVYEKFNIKLGRWLPYRRAMLKSGENKVLIAPPSVFMRYMRNQHFHSAFATGWDHWQKRCSIPLRISDHADWNELLTLVEKVSPQQLFVVHGNGSQLKQHFQPLGLEVTQLA